MTRAVAFIFDQVKDLINRHAEMHADRAPLVAELEQAR
jgi:predicted secreted Zn-dependent protease